MSDAASTPTAPKAAAPAPAEVKHYWSTSFVKGKVSRTCLKCDPRHSQVAKTVVEGVVTEWQDAP